MFKRLIYAISALFLLCGCAAGRKSAQPEQPAGQTQDQSLAGPDLQKETLSMILFTDDALSTGKCAERRIVKKEVIDAPAAGSWTERWTLARCGAVLRYRVYYASGKKGKAYFTVKKEQ